MVGHLTWGLSKDIGTLYDDIAIINMASNS